MNSSAAVSWSDLQSLFSIVMCIDESMNIVCCGETLSKFLPETKGKPALADVFNTVRPSSFTHFRDGIDNLDSLCLLTAKNGKFAIRGQLFETLYQGQKALCFCGAPWLHWINSNCPETHLRLDDFSSQDVQLDQLLFMSTKGQMVNDLEKLNSDLQSAKKELEKTQQAQRQFFAQMSHEIRTPLNGLVSALSLLDQSAMESGQTKFLQLAQRSSQHLMQVINYVLSISKIELAPSQEQMTLNLTELIQSTVDIVRAKAEQKSLDIRLNLSPDLPQACYGHSDRLRQTLLNLLINAIKFTDKGVITINALPVTQDDDQCVLRMEVIDTGAGIAGDHMEHIFEPFWSFIHEASSHDEEGTGLGLDIVRRNVQSMGGEIQVSSTPGEGSRFWFDLPVTPLQASKEALPLSASQQDVRVPDLAGRVLLVDDNETNLILGALILESFGVEVTSADCGQAAVTAARERDFDLVLMDISMPDIDGLEATRQIRAFAGNDQLPIVALTAHIDVAEKDACLDVGMDDYLTKPIDKKELRRAISKWLAKDAPPCSGPAEETNTEDEKAIHDGLVDQGVLDNLVQQIGCDNLQVVLNKVQTESVLRWNDLVTADMAGDKEATQRHVHSLASIFRSVGLMPIGEALGEIETKLRAGTELLPGWLNEFEQLKVVSMNALTERIEDLSRSATKFNIDTN